jgi:hypothetical protein
MYSSKNKFYYFYFFEKQFYSSKNTKKKKKKSEEEERKALSCLGKNKRLLALCHKRLPAIPYPSLFLVYLSFSLWFISCCEQYTLLSK